jgi:hypothetical protein
VMHRSIKTLFEARREIGVRNGAMTSFVPIQPGRGACCRGFK